MGKRKIYKMIYIWIAILCAGLGGILYGCRKVWLEIASLDARRQKTAAAQAEKTAKEKQQEAAQQKILALQTTVQGMLDGFSDGEWAVYVKSLKDGGAFDINSHQMESASLIKLFIMGATWQAIENGTLPYDEQIQSFLWQMVTVSDNESSNRLVEALSPSGSSHPEGRTAVNGFAAANGFADTSQGRDLQDYRAVEPVEKNYTSVRDCGQFLENVYRGTCVSEAASAQMLELLKAQELTGKIPAGLPEGTVTANKTGEVSTMEHDAAIVYSPSGDYILCVMSVNLADTETARQHIRDISATVYHFFQDA